ncbi:hypothetical protein R5R35_012351 [Gryllus longicercus]|uniref:Uncharacterized protein n=1 Tax=Gryllus longicercus TaxID=2509291 RepID=A0AAN9YZA0_9ORTH
MAEDPEKLFLMEFLVESVYVHKHGGQMIGATEWMMCGPTAVSFQFMTFPTLEILETEFPGKGCPGSEPQMFESGKSCLFSLPERVLRNAPGELIINVEVSKNLPAGCSPNMLKVGETKIDFTNEFNSVVSDIYKNPNKIPATKSRKECYALRHQGGVVGQIKLFIRLSCFGKLIITQFTLASGKSYLFKGNKDTLYKCQEVDTETPISAPCGAGVGRFFPQATDLLSAVGQRLGISHGGQGEHAGIAVAPNTCAAMHAMEAAEAGLPCEWFSASRGTPAPKCGPGKGPACFKITKGQHGDQPPEPLSSLQNPQCATTVDDAYVLRVGKRCTKGCDEKEQLELELRAPPQRYKDTKETQWEELAEEGKGKGKKGKKEKGKKGKKGKKKK